MKLENYRNKMKYIDVTDGVQVNDHQQLYDTFVEITSLPKPNIVMSNIDVPGEKNGKSFFTKFDSSTGTVLDVGEVPDFSSKANQLNVNGQNAALNANAVDIDGDKLIISMNTNVDVLKTSKNRVFDKFVDKVEITDKFTIGYEGNQPSSVNQVYFEPSEAKLNAPENIVNKYGERSDQTNGQFRLSLTEKGKSTFNNARGLLEIANQITYVVFSTAPDVIKLLTMIRLYKMYNQSGNISTMLPNPDFTFIKNVNILPLDDKTWRSANAQDSSTITLIDDGKNTKAIVLLANIIVNGSIPIFLEMKKENRSFVHYLSGINLTVLQRYTNVVIYTNDVSNVDSIIRNFAFSDINEEITQDALAWLCNTTGNREDVGFADLVVQYFKVLEWLDTKGIKFQIPMQSYPTLLGMFKSNNNNTMKVTSRSEYRIMQLDSYLLKNLMVTLSIFISVRIKTVILDFSNSRANGQQNNLLKEELRLFFNYLFSLWSYLSVVPFKPEHDYFISTDGIDLTELQKLWKISIEADRNSHGMYSMSVFGPKNNWTSWYFSKSVEGFAFTQLDAVALFCERKDNVGLISHYDMTRLVSDLGNSTNTEQQFKFNFTVNSVNRYISEPAFSLIAANVGIGVRVIWLDVSLKNVKNNEFVPRSNTYGTEMSVTNKIKDITIPDNYQIQNVLDDLKNVLRSSGKDVVNNEKYINFLLSISQQIVKNNIKYQAAVQSDGTYRLKFFGVDQSLVRELDNEFATVPLNVKKPSRTQQSPVIRTELDEERGTGDAWEEDDLQGGDFDIIDLKGKNYKTKFNDFNLKENNKIQFKDVCEMKNTSNFETTNHKKYQYMNNKPTMSSVVYKSNETLYEVVCEKQGIEAIAIKKEYGDNNCIYDSLQAVIPVKDKNNLFKQNYLKETLVKYDNGKETGNVVNIRTLFEAIRKTNVNVRLVEIIDQFETVRITTFGKVLNDKFIVIRRIDENTLHAKPYKIKDLDGYYQRLYEKIKQHDLFRIGYNKYAKVEGRKIAKYILSYVESTNVIRF